MVRSHHLG